MNSIIDIIQDDITRQNVDALVNAANTSLLGGGGVDGAIHQAAGPKLLEECRNLNGCLTGEAKITEGYMLPAKWVIHTVGPVWRGGNKGEDDLLANCYKSCFSYVSEYAIETLAFPSISTGVYRFPIHRASKIALEETKRFLSASPDHFQLSRVVFVCFSKQDLDVYHQSYTEVFG